MAQNIKLNTVVEGTLDVSGNTTAGTVTLDGKLWFEGPTSNYLIGVQDGNGRIQHKWNATSGTAEKYLVTGEPALKWDLDPITPATDLWSIDYAGNGTAGGTIAWTRVLSVGTTNFAYYGNDIFHEGNKTSLTITESQISDLGTYEPAFSKNNAFNDSYGSAAGTVCQGNDSRLSNARTPTAHTHTESDITDLGNYEPAFTKNTGFNKALGNSAGQVAEGNHVHPASDITSGTFNIARIPQSSITITESQISDLGTYEPAFSKNSAFNDNYGTSAGTVTQGNDSRLSNARTPTAHNHDASDITTGTLAVARTPNHDALTGFVTNEHLDWTTDRGANNIHANNILSTSITQHQASLSITESQISDLGTYEPAFAKSSGFNKAYGTGPNNVAQGDHTHPASDIVSGTLADARIPNLNASKITAGTLDIARIPQTSISITESQISDLSNYLVKNVASEFTTQAISFRLNEASAADFNGIEFRLTGSEGAGKFGGVYGNQVNQTNQNVSLFKSIGAVVQSEVKVEDDEITLDTAEVTITSPEMAWTNSQPNLRFRAGSAQSTFIEFEHNLVQRANIEAAPGSLNFRRFLPNGTTEQSNLQITDNLTYFKNQLQHTEFHISGTTHKLSVRGPGTGAGDVAELELYSGVNQMRIAAPPSMSGSYTMRMPTSAGTTGQQLQVGSTSGQFVNMVWV